MPSQRLRELIRTVAQQHPGLTTIELSHKVAQATPPDDIITMFGEVLVPTVRAVVAATPPHPHSNRTPSTPKPSPKLEERRNWWRDMLTKRVHTGGGVQKKLGDCTVDDLTYCIKERNAEINRLQDQIGNFQHLISLMLKHGAYTVSGLPEQTQWKKTPR